MDVPVTLAVKGSVSLVPIMGARGATVTRTPESMVTMALAVAVLSALAIAVTVTVFGLGT